MFKQAAILQFTKKNLMCNSVVDKIKSSVLVKVLRCLKKVTIGYQ